MAFLQLNHSGGFLGLFLFLNGLISFSLLLPSSSLWIVVFSTFYLSVPWSSPIHFGPFASPVVLFQLPLTSSFSFFIPPSSALTFPQVKQQKQFFNHF